MTLSNRTVQICRSVRSAGRRSGKGSWLRPLCLVLLIVGLTACSTRFLYNKIDSFVVWKLGGFVSLTSAQKDELKQQLGDQLEVVRQDELPRVAVVLDEAARGIEANDVTPILLDDGYRQMLELLDEFMLGIVPISEWLLLSLSDEQVEELFLNLEELNQEMYDDYSGPTDEERRENRNKSAIKMAQRFTGRLSDEQKLLITDSLARMADSSVEWIDYQREWQGRFRDLVENPPPSQEFRDELTLLFVYPRSFHSPEYRATVDANRVIFNSMLAELLTGLTDKQRSRVVEKLDGYAGMLRKLSDESA
jgi:hypothetical protein